MALPDIQLSLRPGIVEFGWGHPDAALLPTADLARAATYALETAGAEALAYGAEQGPGRLIEAIRQRLAQTEGDVPPEDHFLISGGISQALEMLCVQLTRPGDVVLVGEPSYHLAQKIFRDHGLQLVGVPSDAQGLHVEAIDALLTMLRRRGERVALVYHVPTFNNPSGATLTPDRRYALAALARREGLLMIEDDAYAELWYDAPPPPPVYNFAPGGPIIRLGSFAKSLAPGLRLGWVQADPQIVQRCVAGGLLDSGGGVNHFTAHVAAAFFELDLYAAHVQRLRAAYGERRNVLLAALARYLPPTCQWQPALGGFFIWIRLPEQLDTAKLLPAAEAAGVAYLPGARFFPAGGGHNYLRLSFSLLPPDELELGARRLGDLVRREYS
ncbi:MAG: PLP-dependent aminotransferase family protein [Oscillochloris sp.]|nr:PLP-dependent aminotransferase family protein [Oscillochloris sp.]